MGRTGGQWTFLTSHARVLQFVARNPTARVREVAAACRIGGRTVQRIVADLDHSGYLYRERVGPHTQYTVHLDAPLRHAADAGLPVRDLLELLNSSAPEETATDDSTA